MLESEKCSQKSLVTWRLMLSVLAACLGSAGLGADVAYSSPAVVGINSHPNSFHLTLFQTSLGSSIIGLGSCVGTPLCGMLSDAFGRRHLLIVITLPIVLAYLIVTASASAEQFIIGRFLTGFFVGVFDNLPNTYIAEISPTHLRGRLVSLSGMFKTVGMLYVFAFGAVVSWNWLSVLCSLFSVVVAVCLLFMFESPRWLLRQKLPEQATFALQGLRGEDYDVTDEILETQKCIAESQIGRNKSCWETIKQPGFIKPLLSVSVLFLIMQFTGVSSLTVNSVSIFGDACPEYDPYLLSIISTVFSLTGNFLCVLVVDRFGRKPLLMTSCSIVAISWLTLGFFLKFKEHFVGLPHVSFIAPACFMLFSFAARIGIVPVPYILLGELFPLHFRGLASGICGSLLWLFVFLSSFAFPYADLYLNDFGNYWAMASIAFLGVFFTLFCVPETKGRALEEIEMSYQ